MSASVCHTCLWMLSWETSKLAIQAPYNPSTLFSRICYCPCCQALLILVGCTPSPTSICHVQSRLMWVRNGCVNANVAYWKLVTSCHDAHADTYGSQSSRRLELRGWDTFLFIYFFLFGSSETGLFKKIHVAALARKGREGLLKKKIIAALAGKERVGLFFFFFLTASAQVARNFFFIKIQKLSKQVRRIHRPTNLFGVA